MLASVLLLPGMGLNPVLGAAVFVGFAVFALFIGNLRAYFWVYLIWACIYRTVQVNIGITKYGDELLSMGWILIILGQLAYRRIQVKDRWFSDIFLFLVGLCAFSFITNSSSLVKMLLFFLSVLFPVGTFFVARNFFVTRTGAHVEQFAKFLFGLLVLQIVLNIGWKLGINPLSNHWQYSHDFAIGSFYSQTFVAYFCCFLLVTLVPAFLSFPRKRLLMLGVFFMALLQLIFSYTMHAWLLLAVGLLFYVLLFSGRRVVFILPVILVFFVIVLGVGSKLINKMSMGAEGYGQSLSAELSLENLHRRWVFLIDGPKSENYVDAFVRVPSEKPIRWLVGAGPGNYMSGVALKPPFSSLSLRYLGKYFMTQSGEQAMAGGSITQNVFSTPAVLMGELGALGLIGYYSLYGYVFYLILGNIYKGKYKNKLQLVLAKGLICSSIIIFCVSILLDITTNDTVIVLFWAWVASVYEPVNSLNTRNNDEQLQEKLRPPQLQSS
jgi:hypothetical protein